jgi:hypothetical protein
MEIKHDDTLLIKLMEKPELRQAAWAAIEPLLESIELEEDVLEVVAGGYEYSNS